jgi:hypothetical protein
MSKAVWIPISCVVLAGLISWGAWNTLATANATPREVHKEDVRELQNDIKEQQKVMIDKLEKIWEKIK